MDSPETLLEHATWLRRLAASLVGDRAAADDLVQETWVAALRRPPDASRPVRPWLARVLRNAARFRWRGETNRAAREAIVAGDAATATPTSEELLARHELEQLLARLVGELAEPFRSTILLRYAEGLEPSQIARRLGIPAGTVRWRIKEGLERLRCALDDAHGRDRKAWLAVLAPIARWSSGDSQAAIAHASHGAQHGSRASRGTHGGTLVAVGLVIATVVAITIIDRTERELPTTTGAPGSTSSAIRESRARAREQPSWFVQAGAPARPVTGRVVRDGVPVTGALVRLVADDAEPLETRSDADGRFAFGMQGATTITLGAAVPDALAAIRHLDLRDPTVATDIELTLLACSARVEGKVTDANGTPIPHAQVLREHVIGTETDATGAYELCALPTAALVAQLDIVVRAEGYGAIATGVAAAGGIRRDFVLAPEATLTGTAVANAAIWIEPDRDDHARAGERGTRQIAIADGEGRFRITGISGGRYRVGGAAHGAIAVAALVSVEAGGTADVTVRMMPAATVRGRVVMRGAPVVGARVAVRADRVVLRHDNPADDLLATGHAVTQADGSFVLSSVPVGPTSFTADPVRVTTPPSPLVAGDNTILLDAEPLGRIAGVVRRRGAPVPHARISMNGPTPRGITTDADGRYVLDGLEPGRYGFYADDQRGGAYGATDLVLGTAETRAFDIELVHGARVTGVVVDAAGAPVANVAVRFTAAGGDKARCTSDATGAFACGALVGGKPYSPAVFPGNYATRPFRFVAPAPEIRLDADATARDVRLAIDPRTTAIAGTVLDETGAPAIDARVRVWGEGLVHDGWIPPPTVTTDAAGRFRIEQLAPGAYEIVAETLHDGRRVERVVTAGTTANTLILARPACIAGAAIDPAHKPPRPILWDDRIELVGWELPERARAGEPFDVTLVFRARGPLLHAWSVFAHFDSPPRRQNADHAPPCSTSTWRTGDVIVDRFSTTLPAAGAFTLKIGFFRPPDGDGPWLNLTGAGDTTGVLLGTVTAE